VQVKHIGYGIRGFYRVAALGHLWVMTPKNAQRRLQILRFWERHGLEAPPAGCLRGFQRRTLYRCGRRPCARRARKPGVAGAKFLGAEAAKTPPDRDLGWWPKSAACARCGPTRWQGKAFRAAVAPWCREQGIALLSVSVSTIGRIIARAPTRCASARRVHRPRLGRSQPLRRYRKPKDVNTTRAPAQCLAVWTPSKRPGRTTPLHPHLHRSPVSRFAFALAIPQAKRAAIPPPDGTCRRLEPAARKTPSVAL
jgi:hypothetical protein